MKLTLVLFFFLILLGCKEENNVNKEFKVDITFKILEEDKIKLYYTRNKEDIYNEQDKQEILVCGSENLQTIDFVLKQIPYKFRIDLGENKNETTVYIASVIIKSKGRLIEINDKTIHRFFKPNIYLERQGYEYDRKIIKNRYDPFLESSNLLRKKIQLEF